MVRPDARTLPTPRALTRRGRGLWREVRRNAWVYAFLAPTLVLFGAFTLWPLVATMYFSAFDWDGVGWPSRFVGLGNFAESLASPYFWGAFKNSFGYTLLLAALNLPLTFALALLLNQSWLRGRTFWRTVFFLPVVTTTAVIGVIAALIIGQHFGPLNELLAALGLPRLNLLSDPASALPAVVAVNVWKSFGYNLVYWLAGLQSIPRELYEAAELDGVTGWGAVWHVTLPLLAPIAAIVLLLQIVAGLNQFDLVWTMTQGGPDFASEVMTTHIYRLAFASGSVGRYGLASAAALFFGIAVMIIALTQWLVLRRLRGATATNDGNT